MKKEYDEKVTKLNLENEKLQKLLSAEKPIFIDRNQKKINELDEVIVNQHKSIKDLNNQIEDLKKQLEENKGLIDQLKDSAISSTMNNRSLEETIKKLKGDLNTKKSIAVLMKKDASNTKESQHSLSALQTSLEFMEKHADQITDSTIKNIIVLTSSLNQLNNLNNKHLFLYNTI